MLNAYFCFNKNFFYQFIAFNTIFLDVKKIKSEYFFDILPVRRLKRVENHCSRPSLAKKVLLLVVIAQIDRCL